MTELCCCQKGFVTDSDTVVSFVSRLQTTKNTNGIFRRWLINHDLLESALQCFVLFNVLAVFIDGGGTDAAQTTTGESGLQKVRSIHRTLRRPSSNNRVHFINEENDFSVTFCNFFQDGLQTLFKLSSHGCTSYKGSKIQTDQAAVFQTIRNITGKNSLRNAFGNSCLSDTWISNQDWIIFGSATQDLNGASDFLVSANDRVQLSFFSEGGEVNPILKKSIKHVLR
mmetsp:Transcript_5557/g.13087  ORF Transcript_5557/g.13087 Transcript_5557/m.13087 type:complete len:226 (-) Transcript_5557:931-1608(-)